MVFLFRISSPIWEKKTNSPLHSPPLSPVVLLLRPPSAAAAAIPTLNHVPFTELEVSVLLFYFTCFSGVFDLAADEFACADSLSSWEFHLLSQRSRQLLLYQFNFSVIWSLSSFSPPFTLFNCDRFVGQFFLCFFFLCFFFLFWVCLLFSVCDCYLCYVLLCNDQC